MIEQNIYGLVQYGIQQGLIDKEDKIYVTNRLLELFGLAEYQEDGLQAEQDKELAVRLEELLAEAAKDGLLDGDSAAERDLFDTKIMGCITPPPSVVRAKFWEYYKESPAKATGYHYRFSMATNYIRKDRIARDEKWKVDTEYGQMDITINLSKPEKDPRDIARAGKEKQSGYPKCLLCKENEGYAGTLQHPARQNHRIIPLTLCGEQYYMQYSPYVYYNEHCIVFHEAHIPMKIDKAVFRKLLDFVRQFPHYMIGSNADLPIVGGSILSHDHFQGGGYEFAMARAPYEMEFEMKAYPEVHAGIVKWPMSVIRLRGENASSVAEAADHILSCWRGYSDEAAFIFAETDGVRHNTITPIARRRNGQYELDLVLRNNITTEKYPWGVYHPTEELHHIKKENIGLIEVMGLAVLPSRLKREMDLLEKAILNGERLTDQPELCQHAAWAEKWMREYDITEANIHEIIREEIGKVFVKVLECAGVYKRDAQGRAAFLRFVEEISK